MIPPNQYWVINYRLAHSLSLTIQISIFQTRLKITNPSTLSTHGFLYFTIAQSSKPDFAH